jgi:hypothetical protein
MSSYAKGTQVSKEKSRDEIERTLARYGADQFMYGWQNERAVIGFRAHGRMIRFELALPDRSSREFLRTPGGRRNRSHDDAIEAWEQACRQRWRALALVVKAKLEAVGSNITTFEEEFLAHIVLPDGRTFGAWAKSELESAYSVGNMPALLPGVSHD